MTESSESATRATAAGQYRRSRIGGRPDLPIDPRVFIGDHAVECPDCFALCATLAALDAHKEAVHGV